MRISVSQSELQNALNIVQAGISSRPSLPILNGVCLQASNNTLTLQSTDLTLSVQYQLEALIEKEGGTVIPAKLLLDIVKSLPDAAVCIETGIETVSITCGSASFSLKCMPAVDYPAFPETQEDQSISISFDSFSRMVKRVAHIASKDETRAILTGVLISKEDNKLKMVATDSFRIAITELENIAHGADDFQAVISASFLNKIAQLPKKAEEIKISLSENQIVIQYVDTIFINRRIEGNYPNYKQLIPSGFSTRVSFTTSELRAAVKRTSLLGSVSSPLKFDINAYSQTSQLSTVSQDVGMAQEILQTEVEGGDVEIAFNYNYILDGLSSIETENVFLDLESSLKPGIFRADTGENYLYLIMPVRV